MSGCKDGSVDSADFGKPMPWIGFYIAAASMVCLLAMIADSISSLMWKQKWVSSRYLSMNTVSLTIFAIVIKLSMDLTTPMPKPLDQIAKLVTSLFICVVISNSIPSLGKMSNRQAVTNSIALAILIITTVVNLCMQLATGIIFTFRITHVLLVAAMLFSLALCGASAISLASIKDYLQVIYEKKHHIALNEFESNDTKELAEKLEDYLTKFSIMAQSSCPQSVLRRSTTWSIVSGFLSSIILLFYMQGVTSDYANHWNSGSDYKESVVFIALIQTIAIYLGVIPKTSKAYTPPKLRDLISWRVTGTISIENYMIQSLIEMKQNQFFMHVNNRHCRKAIEGVISAFFYFFIAIYCGVIFVAQVIYFFWACCFSMVSSPIICCYQSLVSRLNDDEATHLNSLKPYVLHLVGEGELMEQVLSHCFRSTQLYLKRGRKEQPNLLIDLLSKLHSPGFDGVFNFYSDRVPPLLDSEQPPSNCWSLPLVTLTSIAIALPRIDRYSIDKLLLSVSEGLLYANQIEDCLNDRRDMIYVKKASKVVWKGVDLHRKWLDIDLVALAFQRSNPREVLEFLADSAKTKLLKSRESVMLTSLHNVSIWSAKEIATYSMYRISKTLLLDYINEGNNSQQSKKMFKKLSMTISDILGACLNNLKCLILEECARSSIEKRKETAFHILDLFGKTERIIEILEKRKIPELNYNQLPFIDEWRLSHGAANQLA